MNKLNEIFDKTLYVLRNYPMVLLVSFLGAVSLIYLSDYTIGEERFVFVKSSLVLCMGISLMFALKILSQRIGRKWVLEIFGIAFLAFFYFILPEKEKDFTEVWSYLIIPVFILSHLLVSFDAFLGKNRELNFWQYNKNLFINIFLTAVFTGVLTAGVELAILAVDKLFDFNFNKIYFDTFCFLSVFGSCFIFLLFNEKGLQYLEKDGNYPVILKFFTQYILIPLLLIYVIILYFYLGKILINWELPRGWVSYLVLAYSVVGILALLLVHPLKEETAKSWVKVFSKIFYYTLVPLIALLFTAIFTRVLEYGYTEPRYFVLLLAIWLTSVVLYFIFHKQPTIKYVPVSLFTFGLFALIFPYLNTFSVAKRSQKNQLENILSKNNLLENSKINFEKKVTDSVADEIGNKFKFLAERNENEFLENLLKQEDKKILDTGKNNRYMVLYNVRNQFSKVEETKNNPEKGWWSFRLVSKKEIYTIDGFNYFAPIPYYGEDAKIQTGKDNFFIKRNTDKFIISLNDKEEWDILPFLNKTMEKYKGKSGETEVPEISTETDLGNYHLKVYFDNIGVGSFEANKVSFGNTYLFVKAK